VVFTIGTFSQPLKEKPTYRARVLVEIQENPGHPDAARAFSRSKALVGIRLSRNSVSNIESENLAAHEVIADLSLPTG